MIWILFTAHNSQIVVEKPPEKLYKSYRKTGFNGAIVMRISYIVFLFYTLVAAISLASSGGEKSYYASIKATEANIRTGPSVRYPIKWLYQRKNWPIEVVATFEGWRKVRDKDNEIGWIHESLLTRKRHVIIQSNEPQELYKIPIKTADVILFAEDGVIAELISCKSDWCKIEVAGEKGWVEASRLWGVRDGELVE